MTKHHDPSTPRCIRDRIRTQKQLSLLSSQSARTHLLCLERAGKNLAVNRAVARDCIFAASICPLAPTPAACRAAPHLGQCCCPSAKSKQPARRPAKSKRETVRVARTRAKSKQEEGTATSQLVVDGWSPKHLNLTLPLSTWGGRDEVFVSSITGEMLPCFQNPAANRSLDLRPTLIYSAGGGPCCAAALFFMT
jgi:hypothetical protein